jgi:hypothetical protein
VSENVGVISKRVRGMCQRNPDDLVSAGEYQLRQYGTVDEIHAGESGRRVRCTPKKIYNT